MPSLRKQPGGTRRHSTTRIYTRGRRGEFCECADFEFRGGPCLHIYAAYVARAKTRPCAGCGQKFRHRDLFEVMEDHGSLTHFVGDRLCRACALAHGVL